jgi:hypothetical protein
MPGNAIRCSQNESRRAPRRAVSPEEAGVSEGASGQTGVGLPVWQGLAMRRQHATWQPPCEAKIGSTAPLMTAFLGARPQWKAQARRPSASGNSPLARDGPDFLFSCIATARIEGIQLRSAERANAITANRMQRAGLARSQVSERDQEVERLYGKGLAASENAQELKVSNSTTPRNVIPQP